MPRTIYGPNGIWEDKFLDLLTNDGNENPKAIIEDKNNTKGIETQPNQNPIAFYSFGSRIIIIYFFFIFF